ncbi:MAG: DNA polymerase III subunit chi [Erythrobacter sp.]
MQVDFYQLSRDPIDKVVVMLARKVLQIGERLLVISQDTGQRELLSKSLWSAGPEEFLAHGEAADDHPDIQPILLSDRVQAANGAKIVIMADGIWRDDVRPDFDRALLLFGTDQTEAARDVWRQLDGVDGIERQIHKQDDQGRWRAGR